ncbi:T9SS type A sorting domain-containing protein [Ulvibacter antarcticus]|uniref:Putative secreted protein (Por secretion system target) n=1 Tax=Ulvibacter antarcticus TaxID=442714 RepID=A0A3L9YAT2_9FLAO|nr:T9SS type A sorting domain-containing protein [Ulvibacter antarcticus]RMA57843.1 putative secreted protein (Por secretion system target) [Ulvibacter antarcticus]
MKKITLLLAAFAATTLMNAQTTMSHSTDQTDITGSVACAAGGTATENSFWRSYTPADFGVTGDMAVTAVEFAVGSANGAAAPFTVLLNLYTSDDVFPAGTFTLVSTQTVPVVEGDTGTILTVLLDTPFNVDPSTEIIMELYDNDAAVNFRIGQNTLGETAPSYLSSAACGITVPTPTEAVGGGFPDDFIMNVTVDAPLGVNDVLLSQVAVYPNPTTDVLNIAVPSTVEVTAAVLYDVLGKNTGVALNNGTMNTAALAKGVYILSVNTTAGTLTQKVVKN